MSANLNVTWKKTPICLGSGGNQPGLDVFVCDFQDMLRLLSLAEPQSVYAIDIDLEGGYLAAGTRNGIIYLIKPENDEQARESMVTRKLIQGAPLLSLCWINRSLLAATDTAGRCLLWDTSREESWQELETKDGVICSVLNAHEGVVAGLSSTGRVLFWDCGDNKLIKSVDVPAPPPLGALVNMAYWSAQEALVCPSATGSVAVFHLNRDEVEELNCHGEALYAIAVLGDQLVTAGTEDRKVKIWEAGAKAPTHVFDVPVGTISMAVFENQSLNLLLVDAQGCATVYRLEGYHLRSSGRLPGKDFRVVATPAIERLVSFRRQRDRSEVRDLISSIENCSNGVLKKPTESQHARLVKLGYEHVSLALRTEEAYRSGDIIQALKFSVSLLSFLSEDEPRICTSLQRHAILLTRLWHLPEAQAVYQRILSIDPDHISREAYETLTLNGTLCPHADRVVEPGIPIADIIESGTVIGKAFSGRFVVNMLQPQSTLWVRLSSREITERYEKVRKECGAAGLPRATTERVWWASRTETDKVELITFGNGETNEILALQFALLLSFGSSYTTVVPTVLFDWRNSEPERSFEEENGRALKALARIGKKESSNPYLSKVHSTVRQALSRLVTEKTSKRNRW